MRRYYRWGLAAVGIIGLLAVSWWLVTRPYSAIREVREEFGITLPITAKLCDSVGSYSPSPDGESTGSMVRVFQLTEGQLLEAKRTALAHQWRELPLPDRSIQQVFEAENAEQAKLIPWTVKEGLYMVKPTRDAGSNRVYGDENVRAYLAERDSAGDVTSLCLGMLDTAENKLYLIKFDM